MNFKSYLAPNLCVVPHPQSSRAYLPSAHAASVAAASRAALRARFVRIASFLSSKIAVCFLSTDSSQYPKLAPVPAKMGYTHRDPRFQSGRISRPSCHNRVAMPSQMFVREPFFPRWPWLLPLDSVKLRVRTEAGPEDNAVNHIEVRDCRMTEDVGESHWWEGLCNALQSNTQLACARRRTGRTGGVAVMSKLGNG